MAVSKIFNPKPDLKRGTALSAEERDFIFVSPPTHAEIPIFSGTTDRGEACYPLRLGSGQGSSTAPAQRRRVSARKDGGTKY